MPITLNGITGITTPAGNVTGPVAATSLSVTGPATVSPTGITFGDATTQTTAAVSGGAQLTKFSSPGTWTKPATCKGIAVYVIAAGGNGGSAPFVPGDSRFGGGGGGGGAAVGWFPAPSIPGPIAVTVGSPGNPASFGALVSATAGSVGNVGASPAGPGGSGGSGSGGDFQRSGSSGSPSTATNTGAGGSSGFAFAPGSPFGGSSFSPNQMSLPGSPNPNAGGGGVGSVNQNLGPPATGGNGGPGLIIVEEFY